MDCTPTDVPKLSQADIAALRTKYYAERDKRLNSKGGATRYITWSRTTDFG